MNDIELSADQLIERLLSLDCKENVCVLDSCGVGHLGSHMFIAGIRPIEIHEVSFDNFEETLEFLDRKMSDSGLAAILTLSYEFGSKIHHAPSNTSGTFITAEPDLFIALFDTLVVHDYAENRTFLTGNSENFETIRGLLRESGYIPVSISSEVQPSVTSNFSRSEYAAAVRKIQERIRAGDTYQTNLTQQMNVRSNSDIKAEQIFTNLRNQHPAPFASFIRRLGSTVVSASPERFFKVSGDISNSRGGAITASPIKGTRRRGSHEVEDRDLRNELLASAKDRAENTMIVDLTRNDLGRICEFGTVNVKSVCEIDEHPTLFHLVSTVSGRLRQKIKFSDILRALFPSGSITGAPKRSTMKIIENIEEAPRGLSMGSIGCSIPVGFAGLAPTFELNVAIRTMVIRGAEASFNVGGGIVIDSDPELEYEESLLKAKALLRAAGATGNESVE